MLGRIPPHKISHEKKIIRTEEKGNRIHIHCSDNTSYEADLLVGADGAYSGVRQSLYKRLDEQGLLPASDLERLAVASINMVGVAVPEDPAKYPELKDKFCHFSVVVGGSGGRSVSENARAIKKKQVELSAQRNSPMSLYALV
jgi:2-polyprenyl-6-methoxyphenol hydroxylase-like FAD-dependent oxidoreductase